ncbi:MAG: hypothetical protein B6226_01145 [Candidatus Cloacimonetes bacterium 4572_65]|nr:MAG: hypothetical protein B6226_01145 [Candidatus Cloacimonetes bacterium 4572_65]
MENSVDKIVKKVIMASAGTGKTYRLSLEYIAILLKYRIYKEFDFSQIVVMTFTRKATAEIREKILDFLKVLSRREDNYLEIVQNLESISNYKVTEDDFIFIKAELLPSILERKDLLQVSTIDSFTTNIFKTMIAPFLKINEFSIDNNANNDLMPMLLNFMLNRENLPIFEPILKKLNLRTIESSEKFVHSLLMRRSLNL